MNRTGHFWFCSRFKPWNWIRNQLNTNTTAYIIIMDATHKVFKHDIAEIDIKWTQITSDTNWGKQGKMNLGENCFYLLRTSTWVSLHLSVQPWAKPANSGSELAAQFKMSTSTNDTNRIENATNWMNACPNHSPISIYVFALLVTAIDPMVPFSAVFVFNRVCECGSIY